MIARVFLYKDLLMLPLPSKTWELGSTGGHQPDWRRNLQEVAAPALLLLFQDHMNACTSTCCVLFPMPDFQISSPPAKLGQFLTFIAS